MESRMLDLPEPLLWDVGASERSVQHAVVFCSSLRVPTATGEQRARVLLVEHLFGELGSSMQRCRGVDEGFNSQSSDSIEAGIPSSDTCADGTGRSKRAWSVRRTGGSEGAGEPE
jgi:hypothetical protein